MEVGELGVPGLSALKSAGEGGRKDPGDVTLLLQLMEERPARGTAVSLNSPTKVLVKQVSSVST